MILVRIARDYDEPDLMRQTPGGRGIWDGVRFTLDPVEECDYLIMLNNRMPTDVKTRVPKENVWMIVQEPYIPHVMDFIVRDQEYFSKVFTHYAPWVHPRYVVSHPALPWYINRSFDQLVTAKVPKKPKLASCISSRKLNWPGHKLRWAFVQKVIEDCSLEADVFGLGFNYIEDKWDGLAPYRYSLAIENSSSPDYWTEKVSDCFLTWTVPIYYGCINLANYFPGDSFITIDIERPEDSIAKIKRVLQYDDWSKRLPALEQARELVLNRYQFFPHLTGFIKSQPKQPLRKKNIKIPSHRERINRRTKITYRVKSRLVWIFEELTRKRDAL